MTKNVIQANSGHEMAQICTRCRNIIDDVFKEDSGEFVCYECLKGNSIVQDKSAPKEINDNRDSNQCKL